MRRKIGVIYQDFRLLDHLSVFDNVALPLRISGGRENQVRIHVSELLSWVGLDDCLDASPSTLSGGEQQRVAIARSLVKRPELLLADEPTGNLDQENSDQIATLLSNLSKDGLTVVLVSHDESLARTHADRVIRMHYGTVSGEERLR